MIKPAAPKIRPDAVRARNELHLFEIFLASFFAPFGEPLCLSATSFSLPPPLADRTCGTTFRKFTPLTPGGPVSKVSSSESSRDCFVSQQKKREREREVRKKERKKERRARAERENEEERSGRVHRSSRRPLSLSLSSARHVFLLFRTFTKRIQIQKRSSVKKESLVAKTKTRRRRRLPSIATASRGSLVFWRTLPFSDLLLLLLLLSVGGVFGTNANEKYCDVLRFFSNPFRERFFLQSFFLPHKTVFAR